MMRHWAMLFTSWDDACTWCHYYGPFVAELLPAESVMKADIHTQTPQRISGIVSSSMASSRSAGRRLACGPQPSPAEALTRTGLSPAIGPSRIQLGPAEDSADSAAPSVLGHAQPHPPPSTLRSCGRKAQTAPIPESPLRRREEPPPHRQPAVQQML
eukprot:115386-Chlamydomonas_euryale.AAC.2